MDLQELEKIIALRIDEGEKESYTCQLVSDGVARIAKKFGEEAVETLIEGIRAERSLLISESADMLYHWLLLLKVNDVDVASIYDELQQRHLKNCKKR